MAKPTSAKAKAPVADVPGWTTEELARPQAVAGVPGPGRWLVFLFQPTALFSLKTSRATSTVGKTLLTPTPYAVKMAFVDAALRSGLSADPGALIRWLAMATVHIGLPSEACVTGTIQKVRQESRAEDRKKDPATPPYKPTIALREMVHYLGTLSPAFDLATCAAGLPDLLVRVAPALNYIGKRGSFMQYHGFQRRSELDATFTRPVGYLDGELPMACHIATLDDFGPEATFDALNSFSPTKIVRGKQRKFVETVVPLGVRNVGPGFVHYHSVRRTR